MSARTRWTTMGGQVFVITADHIEGRMIGGEPEPITTIPFKLYDDDNNLYYEGMMEPGADDGVLMWGTYFAGCTRIDTKDGPSNTWQTSIG